MLHHLKSAVSTLLYHNSIITVCAIFIIILFSCNQVTKKVEAQEEEKIEASKKDTLTIPKKDSVTKIKDSPPIQYERPFVIEHQGTYFLSKPRGEKLGKFPLNSHLKVLLKTSVTDSMMVNGKTTVGEWYGVEYNTDTVYVFSGHLSYDYVESDIFLYTVGANYTEEDKFQSYFVNLSETYFSYYETDESAILQSENLGENYLLLNKKQKEILLSRTNINLNDTIFLFILQSDTVLRIPVKNLTAAASLNIYSHGNKYARESEYELGFELDSTTNINGDCFVFIGKTNPFNTGEIKQMVWKQVDPNTIPLKFDKSVVPYNLADWFDAVEAKELYTFTDNTHDYFIQNLVGKINYRYLVVVNSNTKEVIFKDIFIDSESTYLTVLNEGGESDDKQWTGKVFKNKPPIIYGFLRETFGCIPLSFLSDTLPRIPILCDNRH